MCYAIVCDVVGDCECVVLLISDIVGSLGVVAQGMNILASAWCILAPVVRARCAKATHVSNGHATCQRLAPLLWLDQSTGPCITWETLD